MKYYKKVLASFLVILMLSSVFSTGATATDMLGVVSAVDNIETHEDHSAITGQALDAEITAAEEEMSKDEFFEYFSSLPGTTTENEYDAFLAEQSQAITRIRNGEAQAGDEELAAFDYREYYYDLKELSESELSYLGYDQNRINIIKNFQGSDAEIRRASADVSGTVLIIHSQINDNVVTTRVRYRFYVDGVFARKKTDTVLLGNVNGFVYNDENTTASGSLSYKAGNASQEISVDIEPSVAKQTSYQTVIAPFDYTIYKPLGPDNAYPHYINSGSIYVTFENHNGSRQASFAGAYKHLTVTCSVSDLVKAVVTYKLNGAAGAVSSIMDFVLSIQEDAVSYGYDEKLMTV